MLSIIPKAVAQTRECEGTIAADSNFPSGAWSLGKGDKRTFRGKVFKGSHGKTRPRKAKKPAKKPA
jgi:ribosomal small subunit protein bTHX